MPKRYTVKIETMDLEVWELSGISAAQLTDLELPVRVAMTVRDSRTGLMVYHGLHTIDANTCGEGREEIEKIEAKQAAREDVA